MESPLLARSFRVMLTWQAIATIAIAGIAAALGGRHALVSAVLGGTINLAANALYALAYRLLRPAGAGAVVIAALRAEASKILLVLLLLFAVLVSYPQVVLAAFLPAFILTAMLFRLVLIVRD